jgi:hypothetical protein
MLHKEISRKEFLSVVAAFFGILALSRLPFGQAQRQLTASTPSSYGNNAYGGVPKK